MRRFRYFHQHFLDNSHFPLPKVTKEGYDCAVSWLERETTEWEAIASQFQDQFGEIIGLLRGLGDFQMVCLTPRSGRFVVGFGAAYYIHGDDLSQLVELAE